MMETTIFKLGEKEGQTHCVVDKNNNILTHSLMHEKDAELLSDLLNMADEKDINVKFSLIAHSL